MKNPHFPTLFFSALLTLLGTGFCFVPGDLPVKESRNELIKKLAHVINPSELTTKRQLGKPTPDITSEEVVLGEVASTKIVQHFESGNIDFPIIYTFNEKGQLVEKNFPSVNEKVELFYDGKGNKIRDKMDANIENYEYNAQGLLTKYQTKNVTYLYEYKENTEIRKGYNSNNELIEEKTCIFSKDTLLVKTIRTKFENGNKDVYESTHDYDTEGNLVKTNYLRTYNGDQKHNSEVRYEYNKMGFVTEEIHSDANKNIHFSYVINDKDKQNIVIIRKANMYGEELEDKFVFDMGGNWILREEKRNGDLEVKHTREIKYRK